MSSFGAVCGLILMAGLSIIGPILLLTGGAGTVAASFARDGEKRILFIFALVLGILLTLGFNGDIIRGAFAPEATETHDPGEIYHLGDEQLKPFEKAIDRIDWEAVGFTPISKDADIQIVDAWDTDIACPGAVLYIPDLPFKRQYICAVEANGDYFWHSEYEVYLGREASEPETIWLAYSSTSSVMDVTTLPYTLVIEYHGPEDSRLPDGPLTLEDV